MAKKNTVAKRKAEVALFTVEAPTFFNPDDNKGNENVTVEDLEVPRLEVCQALSPCLNKNDPAYIEGITPGDLYNSVSRRIYGESVMVVPISFKKQYMVWKDRKSGGGFGGAFNTMAEAENCVMGMEDPTKWDINDTALHFALIVDPSGQTEQVVITMAKSKLRISRRWNSLIRMLGGPRWSHVYKISAVMDQNRDGDSFYNLTVESLGYLQSKEIFSLAEELYETVGSGFTAEQREEEVPPEVAF